MRCALFVSMAVTLITITVQAEPLRVICWNIERGFRPDANPYYISWQITEMPQYDLWGLSEVSEEDFDLFEEACEFNNDDDYSRIEGSASTDRLLVVYNTERFELLHTLELTLIEDSQGAQPFTWRHIRPPLGGKFKDKATDKEFFFFVNHFHRSNAKNRQKQAHALRLWAEAADAPVIASGDFNFDWDIDDKKGNPAFRNFILNNTFEWIKPQFITKTQASPRYNSVLDFIFIAKAPDVWSATSSIIVKPGDLDDNETAPDHRPVDGFIHLK